MGWWKEIIIFFFLCIHYLKVDEYNNLFEWRKKTPLHCFTFRIRSQCRMRNKQTGFYSPLFLTNPHCSWSNWKVPFSICLCLWFVVAIKVKVFSLCSPLFHISHTALTIVGLRTRFSWIVGTRHKKYWESVWVVVEFGQCKSIEGEGEQIVKCYCLLQNLETIYEFM